MVCVLAPVRSTHLFLILLQICSKWKNPLIIIFRFLKRSDSDGVPGLLAIEWWKKKSYKAFSKLPDGRHLPWTNSRGGSSWGSRAMTAGKGSMISLYNGTSNGQVMHRCWLWTWGKRLLPTKEDQTVHTNMIQDRPWRWWPLKPRILVCMHTR